MYLEKDKHIAEESVRLEQTKSLSNSILQKIQERQKEKQEEEGLRRQLNIDAMIDDTGVRESKE